MSKTGYVLLNALVLLTGIFAVWGAYCLLITNGLGMPQESSRSEASIYERIFL